MPSPFPGMDPYIETPRLWTDFLNNLASEIQAQVNRRAQPRYFARLTPYVTYEVIEVEKSEPFGIRPDVGVVQPQPQREQALAMATISRAPVISQVALEVPLELMRVEIHSVELETIVTVIEILSPVNKRRGHEAFSDYQRKRRDLFRTSIHLMEIDLLRGGERPPLEKPVPEAPYYVLLSRANRRPRVEVWPLQLGEHLPVLPVPLFEPDPDVPLDLGAAVAQVYERGAYGAQIDYRQPPPPPHLNDEQSALVASLSK